MSNTNKLFVWGTSFVLVFIAIVSVFFIFTSNGLDEFENEVSMSIHYKNGILNMLEIEHTTIDETSQSLIEDIFTKIKSTPKSPNLKPVIPQDVELLDFELQGKLLDINISSYYNEMSDTDKIFLICGTIFTFLEWTEIDGVKIFVEGEELLLSTGNVMGYLNRTSIINNTVIQPDKIQMHIATLYFSNADSLLLLPETRAIYVKQTESVEYQIVEQLVSGPNMLDHFSTIPAETKVNNIKTELGICYVDLNQNFVSKQPVQSNSEITIYSIVNSLTELDDVEKVQFLIDGRKVDYYNGINITNPLDRNEGLIYIEDDIIINMPT